MRFILIALLSFSALAQDGIRVEARLGLVGNGVQSHGNGVAIGKHQILTVYHVVEGKGREVFVEVEGDWLKCSVVRIDVKNDLALLQCKSDLVPVEIVSLPKFVVSGGSRAEKPTDTEATLKAIYLNRPDSDNGISGSPVLAEGKLIGIVTCRGKDNSFVEVVPANIIAEFVK